jgi:hypothetical protein
MRSGLFLVFFLCIRCCLAQDSHYWQSDYCPGGFLTPGAAIAYDNGKGLFYYNPSLLAINGKTTVSISANIYQLESLKIRDGVGDGLSLSKTGYRINPQMIAGTLAFKKGKGVTIGYALVRNPVMAFDATQRQDRKMQVLDDSYSPGEETYVGQYSIKNITNTTTGIAAAGFQLNEHWSMGITAEVPIRSQDYLEQFSSRALVNTTDSNLFFQPLVNVQSSYEANYWHVGLRFKAGLAFNSGIHHLGLVLSTPMMSLKGQATIASDLVISDLRLLDTVGVKVNLLANGRQTRLPVTYKMPLSIALGYAVDHDKGQVYVAAEYFSTVKSYNIITPSNIIFIRPDTGTNRATNTSLLQLRESRKMVVNLALGCSYSVSELLTLLGSVRTDVTYSDPDRDEEFDGTAPYTSSWNMYHLELGGAFRTKKANLRAGVLGSYGRTGDYVQPVNFDNPNEGNTMTGDPHKVKASSFTIGVLIAYVYNL